MDDDILEKSFVIYALKDLTNAKIYIGQTTQMLKIRLRAHKCNKKSLIGRAIHAHGWENFTVEILEECATEAELHEREMYWIKTLNTKAPNGYNLTDGGDGISGFKASEKSRQLRSEHNPRKRAVICCDTNEIFESITAAARHFNISINSIYKVCRGERIRAGGLKFEYLDAPLSEEARCREAKKLPGKAVRCITNGIEFPSVSEAARYFNLDRGHLSDVCSGRLLRTGGLNFEFIGKPKKEARTFPKRKSVQCRESGAIYPSIAAASKATGIHRNLIGRACNGKNQTAGGCHWQFITT